MNYLAMTGGFPWLTTLILLPLIGAILAALGPEGPDGRSTKWGSFALSLAPLGLVIFLFTTYQGGTLDNGQQQIFHFGERLPWITVLGIDYKLGLDGLSLPLVLLTTLMTPIAILA